MEKWYLYLCIYNRVAVFSTYGKLAFIPFKEILAESESQVLVAVEKLLNLSIGRLRLTLNASDKVWSERFYFIRNQKTSHGTYPRVYYVMKRTLR